MNKYSMPKYLKYIKYAVQAIILLVVFYLAIVVFYSSNLNSTNNMVLSNMAGGDFQLPNNPYIIIDRLKELEKKNKTDNQEKNKNSALDELPRPKNPTINVPTDEFNSVSVKTPGFEVEISEGVSWMTVIKALSILLIGYIGIKITNFTFNKLNNRLSKSSLS